MHSVETDKLLIVSNTMLSKGVVALLRAERVQLTTRAIHERHAINFPILVTLVLKCSHLTHWLAQIKVDSHRVLVHLVRLFKEG